VCSTKFDFTTSSVVPTTVETVLEILQSLNVNKATGPDGIPARMLRLSASAIVDSMTKLLWTV